MQTPVRARAITYWLYKPGTVIWICSLAARILKRISIDDNHERGY